jgi:hypothetical protein
MGKASTGRVDRRERIALQRAAEQRARTRNRVLLAGGAIVAVVAVVLALVLAHAGQHPIDQSPGPTGASLARLTTQVTSVPAGVLDQVGSGQVTSVPSKITGAPLTSGGKPEMLYIGAEYCPYCAVQRWPMIVALSRFGTFTGLTAIRSGVRDGSGAAEPYPATPTWTFANSRFTSSFLTFTSVEEFTNKPDKATGGYTPLQTPTAEQQALLTKYDSANSGAIPFLDFGNRFTSIGATYDPTVLKGLDWNQIAADLHDPTTKVAKGVLGAANYMTAALCTLTGDKPASACTPAIQALQAKI